MMLHLSTFILLPILSLKSSAIVFKRNYQDQTSWAFHQPTIRYEKAKFEKTLVKNLASIKIDKADDVRILSLTILQLLKNFKNTFAELSKIFYKTDWSMFAKLSMKPEEIPSFRYHILLLTLLLSAPKKACFNLDFNLYFSFLAGVLFGSTGAQNIILSMSVD